ncbi:MAG TPA: hypothetical protein VHF92_14660 [Geodermatophilus sp.]|nr:hypothetical protein [Geodermatophilus sp.]
MQPQRPIGWWIKRLDALLEDVVDAAVAGEGLTRRQWQVLHSLADRETEEAALRDGLRDFAAPRELDAVLADLVARGWVERPEGGRVRLTADGRAAHDRIAAAIGRVRRHVTDGLSQREYERTVLVLSRMAANVLRALGRAED